MVERLGKKIWRDLWGQKARTILVILSIAVGVLAIGVLIRTHVVVLREMAKNHEAGNPASATLNTDPFDDELLQTVRAMPEVAKVEGRRSVNVRLQLGPDEWTTLRLIAIDDFADIQLNTVRSESGSSSPNRGELLLERSAPNFLPLAVGDEITVQMEDGYQREITISGTAYDSSQIPSLMSGIAYGYVTFDTLEWLGLPRSFNELNFSVAQNADDKEHIQRVSESVVNKVEKSGYEVFATTIPEPGEHWFEQFFLPIAFILEAIGILTLFLSGFLVVTTVTALLTQQTRQIGIMKAIGGRTWQITLLYLALVLLFGLFSLLVAMPLASVATRVTIDSLANFANLEITSYESPPGVFLLEIALALLVPVLAALYPILSSTGMTVREAISYYGLSTENFGDGRLHRFLESIRRLPRPLLMSLRNTFRNRGRLALTLTTLTLGGAIFMSVMIVRTSLTETFGAMFDYWQYDVQVTFKDAYRLEEVEREAQQVAGVEKVEGWGRATVRRLRDNDTESAYFPLYALPAATEVVQPTITAGRWLLPDDENALVINSDLLKDETDIQLGDEITLKIEGRDETWQVVGVIKGVLAGPVAYANYPYFAHLVREPGQGSIFQIVTSQHDADTQAAVAQTLESHFKRSQLRIDSILTTADEQARTMVQLNLIVAFLVMVAVLLGTVGAIGLTGTMGITVLERAREIGVIRAVGASNRSVFQVIVSEGVVIGLISWLLGVVVSLPLSKILSDSFGNILTRSPLDYTFSVSGIVLWLLIAILLSALASFFPARTAVRMTVREVLAYE